MPAYFPDFALERGGFGYFVALDLLGAERCLVNAAAEVATIIGEVALVVVLGNLRAVGLDLAGRVGLRELTLYAHLPWQPRRSLRPDLIESELDGTLVAHAVPLSVQDGERTESLAHAAVLYLAVDERGPFLDVLLLHELIIVNVLELLGI